MEIAEQVTFFRGEDSNPKSLFIIELSSAQLVHKFAATLSNTMIHKQFKNDKKGFGKFGPLAEGRGVSILQGQPVKEPDVKAHHSYGEARALSKIVSKSCRDERLASRSGGFLRVWVGNPLCSYFHRLVLLSCWQFSARFRHNS